MSEPKQHILVIGGATLDTIIDYQDMETLEHRQEKSKKSYLLLQEGKKIEVLDMQVASGGAGTNATVSFHKQGFMVIPFCKLGKDLAAQQIIDELKSYNIETSYIQYSKTRKTGNSYIVPSLEGDRTIFAHRGANATLLAAEIPSQIIENARRLYISSLSYESAAALPGITELARKHRIPVAINPGISQITNNISALQQSLTNIDIISLNNDEAMLWQKTARQKKLSKHPYKSLPTTFTNWPTHVIDICFSLEFFIAMILAQGPKILIITLGHDGVVICTSKKLYYHACEDTPIVNTLGAGDAFASAFVAANEYNLNIESCIRWGMANAASVIQHKEAKTGLQTRKQLESTSKKINSDLLHCQAWQ
jgi:ribokinase